MRLFRPKASATGSDQVDEEKRKAMIAEFDRRIMGFKKMWRRCPVGRCRRQEQCLGPPFACKKDSGEPRWTRRQRRRLRRDIIRNPPLV